MSADASLPRGWRAVAARQYRPMMIGLALVILAWAAVQFLAEWNGIWGSSYLGYDYGHYLDAVHRWIETGSPYLPNEVAAPFPEFEPETFLHPPISLPFFAAFLILPAILWWAIPIAIVAWSIVAWRPAPWTWPWLALVLAWPRTPGAIIVGNTDMWAAAVVALALRFGWPGALMVLKPSYFPLIFIGCRRPSWWRTIAVLGLASLLFGTLWIEWIRVVRNAPGDFFYSLPDLPLVLIAAVAWLGRRRSLGVPAG
jgi:hypothetical protein